jgi:ABC-type multidrug transport system fused ATPase/permease subunit
MMIIEVLGEIFMPKFMAQIINNGVANQNVGYIVGMGVLMLVTSLLMMLGGVGGAYFGAKASINFGADVRKDVYAKVQTFSFSNIDKFSTASLVTRLTNDITQVQNFVNMLLRMCLRAPGMLIGALIMALQINARLKALDQAGGAEVETARIATMAKDFRDRISHLPLDICSESLSNAVTPLMTRNCSAHEIFMTLKDEYGIWVCPNGGALKDKIFRVGHIGALTEEDHNVLIHALNDLVHRGLLR